MSSHLTDLVPLPPPCRRSGQDIEHTKVHCDLFCVEQMHSFGLNVALKQLDFIFYLIQKTHLENLGDEQIDSLLSQVFEFNPGNTLPKVYDENIDLKDPVKTQERLLKLRNIIKLQSSYQTLKLV